MGTFIEGDVAAVETIVINRMRIGYARPVLRGRYTVSIAAAVLENILQ